MAPKLVRGFMYTFMPYAIKSFLWKRRSAPMVVSRRYLIPILFLSILIQSLLLYFTFLPSSSLSSFTYPLDIDLYKMYEHSISNKMTHRELVPSPINPTYFATTNQFNQSQKNPTIVFFIKSSVTNFEQRKAIRQTWANPKCWYGYATQIEFVFIVGQPDPNESSFKSIREQLKLETLFYKDMAQFDILDTYHNVTYKLMATLQLSIRLYGNARFFVLLDDDYFVHPKNLWQILSRITQTQYPIYAAGDIVRIARPVRLLFHRWFVSYHNYPFKLYPPFPSGGTIILSSQLAKLVSFGLAYTKFLPFEDVLLGIVLFKLGISPIQIDEIFSIRPFHGDFSKVISAHGFKDPVKLLKNWSELPLSSLCYTS